MLGTPRWLLIVLALVGQCTPIFGQTAPGAADPLGRSNPRTTLVRFLEATHGRNYAAAAEYLENTARDGTSKQEMARMLAAVLDRELTTELSDVSDNAEGALDDGLPPDRELIAHVNLRTPNLSAAGTDTALDILLHRQTSGIWLFAAETQRALPAIYGSLTTSALEKYLPAILTQNTLLGVALWRWIALALLLVLAICAAWLVTKILVRLACGLAAHSTTKVDDAIIRMISGPARLCIAVLLFHMGMAALDLPYLLRWFFRYGEIGLFVTAITWFLLRVVDLAAERVNKALIHRNRVSATSIVPLGRRVVKAFLVFIALLALMDNLGFDSSAALAGLGVGGIAVALAAQKTLENLFGGGSIVFDQPVRVGDFCKFGDSIGTVEDIGLRSTRIRTLDRTVISIPNSQFASLSLENFAPREKMWFHPVLKLRLDTTPAQLREVLSRIRQILEQETQLEKGARIRLVKVGDSSLDLEIFAYVLTPDFDQFLAIQEDLLLKLLETVEAAEAKLVVPNQLLYAPSDQPERHSESHGSNTDVTPFERLKSAS